MYDVPPHSSSSAAASARPSPECERRPPLGPADCLLRPAQSPAHGARRLGYEEQLPHQRIARPARRRRRRSNAVQRVLLQKHAPARPRLDEQADASYWGGKEGEVCTSPHPDTGRSWHDTLSVQRPSAHAGEQPAPPAPEPNSRTVPGRFRRGSRKVPPGGRSADVVVTW